MAAITAVLVAAGAAVTGRPALPVGARRTTIAGGCPALLVRTASAIGRPAVRTRSGCTAAGSRLR
ncbi:hypothetical protein, partial [Nonomuraea zeae]|uniref:hypothetical protein n=1 Tax=Nonomuraea zeae TaxID=1642303 RepID=UPI00197E5261